MQSRGITQVIRHLQLSKKTQTALDRWVESGCDEALRARYDRLAALERRQSLRVANLIDSGNTR